MGKRDNLIIGLDIGTTKTCAIVGELAGDGIDIIGIGSHPSNGLKKGVIINIESTMNSIRRAIEEAELMAGCEIDSVYAGIAGMHIKGFNSHGVIAVKSREVTESDVRRVVEAARAIAIPLDKEVIHILPQEFIIDEQDGIREPLGMSGVRLEARVHIVTGSVSCAQNIVKCCNRTGLSVRDVVLEQLASADAVLNSEEKELGVALVDIGGGTTDIAIFHRGAIRYTSVVPLGGDYMTGDIAVGLRTPTSEAEKIKQKYGAAMASMVKDDESIEVPSIGERKIRSMSRKVLCDIIEPRVEEILSLAHREVMKSGLIDVIASGIVLTGGGAIMDGMIEMGEKIFDLPVRRGIPHGIGGLVDVVSSPIYATGVGLTLYGARDGDANRFRVREDNLFYRVTGKMKELFMEFF